MLRCELIREDQVRVLERRDHYTPEIIGGNIHQKRTENSYEEVENQVLKINLSRWYVKLDDSRGRRGVPRDPARVR